MADYSTPMNNLKQNGFEPSSARPGVSGESVNAPYGPKACEYDDISNLKDWGDQHNVAKSGFAVGKTSGPPQAGMGKSSVTK